MQRNVSTPLQLHELNLVNKSNTDLSTDRKVPPLPVTPRKTQPPVNGPRLNIKTTVVSPKRNTNKNKEDNEEKLYKLAQKKREIGELEERLAQLKRELKIMEQEFYIPSSQPVPVMNNDTTPQQIQSQGRSKFKDNRFVKSILTKFDEFNIGEDEFDDHVKSQNESDFYLKEGYDLGEDELEREAQEEIGFLQRFNKWQAKK